MRQIQRKGPTPRGEDRPHVGGNESGEREGVLDAVGGGLRPYAVSILEHDGAPVAVTEQCLDVGGERVEDRVGEAWIVGVGIGCLGRRVPARDVSAQGIVSSRLVGDDVELNAPSEKTRDDVGRIADESDRPRAVRIEVRGERLVVLCDEVDPAVAQPAFCT